MSGPTNGEKIARYEVQKLLGEGGMGRVVLARDPLLRRVLAVKTLLDPSPHSGLRFTEEAQITGQLDHPNIMPVHVFDEAGGTPYLAMRFVQGMDLKALVKSFGKPAGAKAYPVRRRLRLFLKVCEAVAHAHDRGVMHRDLKPANVMLGEDDEVLVMDWGLAKPIREGQTGEDEDDRATRVAAQERRRSVTSAARADGADLTQEGAVVGTPAYMPPEQASDGATIDRRADVYSLGALLYELLTHRQPYNGSSLEVLAALVTGKPAVKPPREAAPTHDIPLAVQAIVQKAMAREPGGRYPDAGALAADIEAFLDDRAVSCHKDTAREALGRLVTRHRVPLLAAGVALVALLGAGGMASVATDRAAATAAADVERAEGQAARARDEAAAAERQAAQARLAATAEVRVADATRLVSELAELARTTTPTRALRERHGASSARIDEIVRGLLALEASAPESAGSTPPAEASASARAKAARQEVDLVLARALVSRRPKLALELLGGLSLGPEGPLLQALALIRRERGPEATQLLASSKLPDGRKELREAAKVLKLLAAEASSADLLQAVDVALKVSGAPVWLLGLRAHLEAREGDFAAAEADYDRALILDPVDAETLGNRMTDLVPMYCHEEFTPYALTGHLRLLDEGLLEGAQEFDPSEVHHGRINLWHYGWIKENLKRIDDLLAVQRITPLGAARARAEYLIVVQDFARAEVEARAALKESPDDRRALGFLAEALVGLGRLEEAAAVAERGLARHRTDGQLAYARGEVARLSGDVEAAVKWHELAAPRSRLPQRWERLARCYLERGDPASLEEGVKAMRRCLSYDVFDSWLAATSVRPLTGDPQYHRTFGDLRRKQGDLAAAALHYQRCLSAPENIPRLKEVVGTDRQDAMRLAEVHEEMGLGPEAHRYWAIVCEDPKLVDEAKRRMARLEGR